MNSTCSLSLRALALLGTICASHPDAGAAVLSPGAGGCVIYKAGSFDTDSRARLAEYTRFDDFRTGTVFKTLSGEVLRLTPGHRPIIIPYPTNKAADPEAARRGIAEAKERFPHLAMDLAALDQAWALKKPVAQAMEAGTASAMVTNSADAVMTLRSGRTLRGWTVSKVAYDKVTIIHADGLSVVPIRDIPKEALAKDAQLRAFLPPQEPPMDRAEETIAPAPVANCTNAAAANAPPSSVPALVATPSTGPESPPPNSSSRSQGTVTAREATNERSYLNSLGMEFLPVPGMGGLLMCRTETRVKDFRRFVEETGYTQIGGAFVMQAKQDAEGGNPTDWKVVAGAGWDRPGFAQTEDHPVVCVGWAECKEFCRWLTKKERQAGSLSDDKEYRLPTDQEWSAAAGTGKYPWGDQWPPPDDAGNYFDRRLARRFNETLSRDECGDRDDGAEWTAPVGSYAGNGHGFHDLGGNVWEWCEDRYRAEMNSERIRTELPILADDPDAQKRRVLRGGSWSDGYYEPGTHSSLRIPIVSEFRYQNFGFRCVLAPAATAPTSDDGERPLGTFAKGGGALGARDEFAAVRGLVFAALARVWMKPMVTGFTLGRGVGNAAGRAPQANIPDLRWAQRGAVDPLALPDFAASPQPAEDDLSAQFPDVLVGLVSGRNAREADLWRTATKFVMVDTDRTGFVGRTFIMAGVLRVSSVYPYKGTEATHYAFRLGFNMVDEVLLYMERTQGARIRDALLSGSDNALVGFAVMRIDPERFDPSDFSLRCELMEFFPRREDK